VAGATQTRPARAGDLDELLGLLRETDALHAELQPAFFRRALSDGATRDELRTALDERREALLVVEHEGMVLGFARVSVYDTPSAPSLVPRRRAHLDALVVATASRRRGLGRRLVAACADWARERGATQMLLTVWEGNGGALEFYRRLGYAPISSVLSRDL